MTGAPAGMGGDLAASAAAVMARKRKAHDADAERAFALAAEPIARARKLVGEHAPVWLIPAQSDPLGPLPAERRAAFIDHLESCASMAREGNRQGLDGDETRRAHEAEEAALSAAACTLCQGKCCRRGGDSALLLPNDLGRHMDRQPGSAVVDDYLARLPEHSVCGACVYQGSTGCALPRAMRQDICNSYHCNPLKWLLEECRIRGTDQAILVAADESKVHRVAAVTGAKVIVVHDGGVGT